MFWRWLSSVVWRSVVVHKAMNERREIPGHGRLKRRQAVGRVFRPTYTKPDGKGGRVRVQVRDWYIEYQGADREKHREKVGPDRRVAQSALARAQDREARRRHGLADPADAARDRNRPLAELRDEYLAVLAGRDTSPVYRSNVAKMLETMSAGCGWLCWPDVAPDALTVFLGKIRDSPGKGNRKPPGLATLNGYVRTAKGFSNWCADKFGVASPLKRLKPYPEKKDRRRSRRILTDAELAKLIAAAESAPRRANTVIDGPSRAALYRVAAYTGLRASELASLTPGHFRLAAVPPVVVVEASDAKGKREEPIPLPGHLAEFLRAWLRGKKAKARLWPGTWAEQKRQVKWLERDAARAGLGAGVLLHGLKRKYVTGLIRSGAGVDQVRRLARHRHVSTTLDYYAGSELPELGEAVDRLPKPG